MASIAPTAQVRSTVELAPRGTKRDVAGRVFQGALLLSLLLSLLILIVLLGTTLVAAWPVLSTAGRLRHEQRTRGSTRGRGCDRASWVAHPDRVRRPSLPCPLGIAAADLPAGIRSRHPAEPDPDHEHPQPRRRARRSCTASSGSWCSSRRCVRSTGPDSFGRSFISGGMTLAVLVLPIVILITMEALRAVPKSIREAAYGVGATRWEVVRSHVLPYAAPGIFTGRSCRSRGRSVRLHRCSWWAPSPASVDAPRADSARDRAGSVHGTADADLLVVTPGGRGWKANTAAAIIVLLAHHLRREHRRDPAEEPI